MARRKASRRHRLDQELVDRGLFATTQDAMRAVMAGEVSTSDRRLTSPGEQVLPGIPLHVKGHIPYVSRGGLKLEHGLSEFGVDVSGLDCLDVGCSTGGFTDCLLQHGAKMVMAVDVGTNQLAYSLRSDPRVWVKENFNARYMTRADLPETPELAVTDVSFISLRLILPPIASVLAPGGAVVALIKPQFEVGKGQAPGGLVRDEALRLAARDGIVRFAEEELGLSLAGLAESPIRGREMGNVEYLAFFRLASR